MVREPDSTEADYFIYDGVRPYGRLRLSNGLNAIYVAEGGSYYSPIVTLRTNNANWTYLRDGMDNVRRILNDSQQVTDVYYYEAFGNITSQSGTTVNPFRYVGALGYYRDQTTSLYHVGARYYSPQVGRFWTRDPMGTAAHDYAYAESQPTFAVDPSGAVSTPGGLVTCGPWQEYPSFVSGTPYRVTQQFWWDILKVDKYDFWWVCYWTREIRIYDCFRVRRHFQRRCCALGKGSCRHCWTQEKTVTTWDLEWHLKGGPGITPVVTTVGYTAHCPPPTPQPRTPTCP
jgi:RHS repeat-associated protein